MQTSIRIVRRLTVVALTAGAILACRPPTPADGRPLVVVSVLPQKYAVERIAEDLVRVEVMIPPGASPATHEPAVAQVRALGEAALYVQVGHPNFPFERTWLDRMLVDTPSLPVVDGSAGLPVEDGDPHIWVAPRRMERMAVLIEAALNEILPDHRERLADNLASFQAEIDALDGDIRAALADKRERTFFVFHPAWGYYAEAYDLKQIAVEHEHMEPDAHRLSELIRTARASGTRVVFVQPQVNSSAAETLAREIGARVEPADPLAYEWADNLRRVTGVLAESLR